MILFQTLSQFLILLKIACVGIFSGFLIYFFNLFKIKNKKFNFVNNFFNFLLYFFIFLIFYFSNLIFNYGEIRPVYLFTFFFLTILTKQIISKVVAKIKNKCYNNHKERKDGRKEKLVEKS